MNKKRATRGPPFQLERCWSAAHPLSLLTRSLAMSSQPTMGLNRQG